jgi:hypothetical protein
MVEFRMPEAVLKEQLALAEPHMAPSVPQNTRQRMYTVREKLMVTLNFLEHFSTLCQLATKFGMPHHSFSAPCTVPHPPWRRSAKSSSILLKRRKSRGQSTLWTSTG